MSDLMNTADWCAELEGFEVVKLTVSEGPQTESQIAAELASAEYGWVCLASKILRCIGGEWYNVTQGIADAPPTAAECGLLLNAEIRKSQASSLHVWRDGSTLRSAIIAEGTGDDALAVEDSFVSTEQDYEMVYRTYWKRATPDDAGVSPWMPYVSRFTTWRPS
ncbi:MAG: hypothetical protein HY646_06655 [Acidobacteria bacterium]|nr:hypothetical protein [Acidobacteriota bacterium]